MLGQMCPLGTGSFDLLLNEQALQDAFEVQVGQTWSISVCVCASVRACIRVYVRMYKCVCVCMVACYFVR
jgi:hypothetical protein